jgi:hypothetical protein
MRKQLSTNFMPFDDEPATFFPKVSISGLGGMHRTNLAATISVFLAWATSLGGDFDRLTDSRYDTVRMIDQTTSSTIEACRAFCTEGRGL